MSWSRAGHPPPLLVSPDGTTRFLDDVNGVPLGTMVREYRTATTRLDPNSLMVCYTDGLVERRDRILDDGLAWLAERVREHRATPSRPSATSSSTIRSFRTPPRTTSASWPLDPS